jgi:hypothetical protein
VERRGGGWRAGSCRVCTPIRFSDVAIFSSTMLRMAAAAFFVAPIFASLRLVQPYVGVLASLPVDHHNKSRLLSRLHRRRSR